MKLQKQLSRKVGDTEYAKYVVVIPSKVVKEMNWKGGEELQAEATEEGVLIKEKS